MCVKDVHDVQADATGAFRNVTQPIDSRNSIEEGFKRRQRRLRTIANMKKVKNWFAADEILRWEVM